MDVTETTQDSQMTSQSCSVMEDAPGPEAGDSTQQTSSQDSHWSSDDVTCYCGKKRNVGGIELQCAICFNFYHFECITCYLGNMVPFMTNYHFFCKTCHNNGLESFTKKQASYSQMCHTALANLTYTNPDTPFFNKDSDIIPYIEKWWESLTTIPRRVKAWHARIGKSMLKENHTFAFQELSSGDILFALVNKDLSKIGPNYALAFKNGDLKVTAGADGTKTTRSTKRKFAPEPITAKLKKGELSMLPKATPHGYPLEHPYNKDGYRYILAEPDPHAANRQAYDLSLEMAGKPIPGFLYRSWLCGQVLLALHDRAPQLKVSDDRLAVTGEKGYSMIRATHGVRTGNWYFELLIEEMVAETATRVGWAQSLGNLQAPCGYDRLSYSWRSRKGTRFHESRGKHYCSEGYKQGDVLGCYISLPTPSDLATLVAPTPKDKPLIKFKNHLYFEERDQVPEAIKSLKECPGSKITFYKNGMSQGTAFEDIYEGTYYPSVSLYKNARVRANFGPEFRCPPEGLEDFLPMSAVTDDIVVQNTLSDILYHIENEGQLPEF